MAEKLFKNLETTNKRFEVKIMTLDVISRLIGLHSLFLFNFYPYIQRFIQPHQREVTRVLQFAAQASHELLPPDALESLLKTIANNFITERNSSDVMAIGLNAVREICARCPLAMNEDLLGDLAQYKTYRDRAVMMAARGLIHLFRTSRPELLHKKDRGRPTEATEELKSKQYAEIDAKDYIPGAEVLLKKETNEVEINSDTDSDEEQWVDIQHSSAEEDNDDVDSESDDEGESISGDSEGNAEDSEGNKNIDEVGPDNNESNKVLKTVKPKVKKSKEELKSAKIELAQKLSLERILTDEDFKRIDMANIKKLIQPMAKGQKRKIEDAAMNPPSELVKLGDIENIYKKRKHDKESRLQTVQEGRVDREKFGYKDGRLNIHCSKTNREKKKTKNYQMIKHKARGKVKRSFKDKQIALRNYLLKQKRMK